ncbi:UNKNOWN [Stylonychia lemnae]|uniref:Uncharacterized protein n=1 Tax=Stylonychia lemnae TaxID=5949 RepID=A0A078AW89_STYLE|nr:UNKNOWN [Stylonychia lemnae]|eukprot:CDW86735.1 UNKNOWN [Stylonychia lemnae]
MSKKEGQGKSIGKKIPFLLFSCRCKDEWRNLKLSRQLLAYASLSFFIFFLFFVSLLLIFALYVFAEYNINQIKDQYSTLNQDRQLQMSMFESQCHGFRNTKQPYLLNKFNLSALKNFPVHPLNWQNENPMTYEQALQNNILNQTVSYASFNRVNGQIKNSTQNLDIPKRINALNPLWVNQREIYMGRTYNLSIQRQYVIYDDGSTSNDQFIFTYPPLKYNNSFLFTSVSGILKNITSLIISPDIIDIFEPNSVDNRRLQIQYPITDKSNKVIAILGIQYNLKEMIKDNIESNVLENNYQFYQILVYSVGDTLAGDQLIMSQNGVKNNAYDLTQLKSDFDQTTIKDGQINPPNGDVFKKTYPSEYGYYVTRVFSPYNYSHSESQRLNYNYMIVIASNKEVDQIQRDEITNLIRPEMNEYLAMIIPSAIAFVFLTNLLLLIISERFISKPIIKLAQQVKDTDQKTSKDWIKSLGNNVQNLDEIAKLRNIFARFFNEEIKQDSKSGDAKKKVELMMEKQTLNLMYDKDEAPNIQKNVDKIIDEIVDQLPQQNSIDMNGQLQFGPYDSNEKPVYLNQQKNDKQFYDKPYMKRNIDQLGRIISEVKEEDQKEQLSQSVDSDQEELKLQFKQDQEDSAKRIDVAPKKQGRNVKNNPADINVEKESKEKNQNQDKPSGYVRTYDSNSKIISEVDENDFQNNDPFGQFNDNAI